MKDLLQRFETMVSELKADPKVQVISYHVYAPATEREIAEVEEFLGRELDHDIKEFYRQCNGLQLRWIRKDSDFYKPREYGKFLEGPFTYSDVLDDNTGVDGCVNILPIAEVFHSNVINRFGRDPFAKDTDILEMNGHHLSYLDFVSRVRVFDLFSAVYDFSFLLTENQFVIVLGCMDHTVFNCSKALSLSAYLELILQTKGECNPRISEVETMDVQCEFLNNSILVAPNSTPLR